MNHQRARELCLDGDLISYSTRLEAENAFLRKHVPISVLAQLAVILPTRPSLSSAVVSLPQPTAQSSPTTAFNDALHSLSVDPALPDSTPSSSKAYPSSHFNSTTTLPGPIPTGLLTNSNAHPSVARDQSWAVYPFPMLPESAQAFWDTCFPSTGPDLFTHHYSQPIWTSVDENVDPSYLSTSSTIHDPDSSLRWSRPPDIPNEGDTKTMLKGTQAWQILMAHPQANQCNSVKLPSTSLTPP